MVPRTTSRGGRRGTLGVLTSRIAAMWTSIRSGATVGEPCGSLPAKTAVTEMCAVVEQPAWNPDAAIQSPHKRLTLHFPRSHRNAYGGANGIPRQAPTISPVGTFLSRVASVPQPPALTRPAKGV